MGLFTKLFLGFVLFSVCMCLSQQAYVYRLHPKYPAADDNEGGDSESSFVSRDTNRLGRTLQAVQTTIFSLKGNVVPYGLYYVTMLIGNPSKPYFLDVDSGSDLTWVQCAPCKSCAEVPHPLYELKEGSWCQEMILCAAVQAGSGHKRASSQQCRYDVKYADQGSSSGVLVRDSVRTLLTNGTVLTANSVFGCGYDQQGSLAESPARTDGVLGLGSGMASLPSQWAKQGLIKNVIGHCIAGGGRDGGYMFFGDDLVPTSAMTWAPMLGKPSTKHYDVGAAQMMFGNKPLDKDGDGKKLGRIIFDSGSSYTYFTDQAYGAFLSAEEGNVCLGILNGTEIGNLDTNVLGDISLQGRLVVYDNEKNQIGWAHSDSDCQKIPKSSTQRRVLQSSEPLAEQFVALEDPSMFHRNTLEEAISCDQEVGKAACPSSSCSLPALGIYQGNSSMIQHDK